MRRLKRKVNTKNFSYIKHYLIKLSNVIYDRNRYISGIIRIAISLILMYMVLGKMVLLVVIHYIYNIKSIKIISGLKMKKIVGNMKYKRKTLKMFPFYFGITQMFLTRFRRKKKRNKFYEIKGRDGKRITLEIFHRKIASKRAILILHGFNGSSGCKYVRNLAMKQNVPVICLNARGIRRRCKKICHIGFTDDIEDVLIWMGKRCEISIVGYSLGGNQMSKVIGLIGLFEMLNKDKKCATAGIDSTKLHVTNDINSNIVDYKHIEHDKSIINNGRYKKLSKVKITCCVGVCAPFNFSKIYKGVGRFPRSLIEYSMVQKYKQFLAKNGIEVFDGCNTIKEINTKIATIFSYESVEEYLDVNSCERLVKYINIPTLYIIANDDILVDTNTIDLKALMNDNVVVWMMDGGHLGFIDNFWNNYCDDIINEFIKTCTNSQMCSAR